MPRSIKKEPSKNQWAQARQNAETLIIFFADIPNQKASSKNKLISWRDISTLVILRA